MLFALWEDQSRKLRIANSGAVQPFICHEGQCEILRAEGFPLGMFPEAVYDEHTVEAKPGDLVVFVSDGILDAEDEKEEMYGPDRLSQLLCASRDLPPAEIADSILADVARFQDNHERFDDETIIVLRVCE
jgi:sigma-B regulation protein RsbU (phosphoserine phosphatase)